MEWSRRNYSLCTIPVHSEAEAVNAAHDIGYPVVIKSIEYSGELINVNDDDILIKGFKLLQSNSTVVLEPFIRVEYQLYLGSRVDPKVGSVVEFGCGMSGIDIAIGLPPLNRVLALRMFGETKIYQLLKKSVDVEELCRIVIIFSQIIASHKEIATMKISPMLASKDRIVVDNATIELYQLTVELSDLPTVPIRPYPTQYVWTAHMRNGSEVLVRPLRLDDEALLIDFHKSLSNDLVLAYFEHHVPLSARISRERISRLLSVDYSLAINLAVIESNRMIGLFRVVRDAAGITGRIFVLVAWISRIWCRATTVSLWDKSRSERESRSANMCIYINHYL